VHEHKLSIASESRNELVAEAFEESLGKRTALYHIVVKSDDGRLIASCQGTVYRKDEKLV